MDFLLLFLCRFLNFDHSHWHMCVNGGRIGGFVWVCILTQSQTKSPGAARLPPFEKGDFCVAGLQAIFYPSAEHSSFITHHSSFFLNPEP